MKDNASAPWPAIGLTLLAMFFITANDAVGKHLTQTYSIWQVLWIRSWVWGIFAILWISQHGGLRLAVRSNRPLLQTVRSLVLVVEISVFIMAFRLLPLGDVTVIAASAPVVVVVLAALFLREHVGWHRWAGVAIGFAGVIAVARPGFGAFGWMTLLPILGVTLWGIYQVLVRLVSRHDSDETTLLWTGAALFVVMTAVAPWFWQTPADATAWMWFVLGGLMNTMGHFGLILALRMSPASALQPFAYSTVVWAMGIGLLVFDEVPDHWTLAGVAAIVSGGLYTMYRERRLKVR